MFRACTLNPKPTLDPKPWDLGVMRVWNEELLSLGFRAEGLGFRVQGLGFRV